MERIAITGGLGFIGSHLAEHFSSLGFEVSILDSASNEYNISKFKKNLAITHGSITDSKAVLAATRDARLIFHEAAFVSVPESMEKPELARTINIQGTKNILEAALANGAQRVVLASSSAVYGANKPPLRESMKPDPLSPYAETKLENEAQARLFNEKGLETVSLRYFNVYGPRQNPDSAYAAVIPRFLCLLKSGKSPVIYGDGSQTRDFIYVKDVVRANILAASAGKGALGKAFNIGSGKPISILALLSLLEKITHLSPNPIFKPERKGDLKHSYADVSLAKEILSFKTEWSLERGLAETNSFF